MVDQDGLELAVSNQVSPHPSRRVKPSLNVLKPRADFSSIVMYVRSGIFFHCRPISSMLKTCGGLYPLLDDGPETIWVVSSGALVGPLSLSPAFYIMEPKAGLKLIKPVRTGDEIGYGTGLLLLQEAVAIPVLLLGVVKGHVKALTPLLIHPCDQHFLQTDHDVRQA